MLDLIRQAGGGVVFEEFSDAPEDGGGSSAVQLALIDEANKLAERLERIRRGDGGV
jgi:hypothetical protein